MQSTAGGVRRASGDRATSKTRGTQQLRGRVVDEVGAGIKGADIEIVSGSPNSAMSPSQNALKLLSGEDGGFSHLMDASFEIERIVVSHSGYLKQEVSGPAATAELGASDGLLVVLERIEHVVRGVVVDARGDAIVDAVVALWPTTNVEDCSFDSLESVFRPAFGEKGIEPTAESVSTSPEGTFRLATGVAGTYRIGATAHGYALGRSQLITLRGSRSQQFVTMALVAAEWVNGLVVGNDGSPVEGADIVVSPIDESAGLICAERQRARSNPDGAFAVPRCGTSRYSIFVGAKGYSSLFLSDDDIPDFRPDAPKRVVKLTLARGRSVTIRLRPESSDISVENVALTLSTTQPLSMTPGQTDKSGVATFEMVPEASEVRIRINAGRLAVLTDERPGDPLDIHYGTRIRVAVSGDAEVVVPVTKSGTMEANVVDGATGLPVPNLDFDVGPASQLVGTAAQVVRGRTDDQGRLRIVGIASDSLQLRLLSRDCRVVESSAGVVSGRVVHLKRAGNGDVAALSLKIGAAPRLRGLVTDVSGTAVAGAVVRVTSSRPGHERIATSDARGDFSLLLESLDAVEIEVRHESFVRVTKTVSPAERLDRLQIILRPGPHVRIRVFDDVGSPAGGAGVIASFGPNRNTWYGRCDPKGEIETRSLPVGVVSLRGYDEPGSKFVPGAAKTITIEDTGVHEIELSVFQVRLIPVEVTTATGAAAADVTIGLRRSDDDGTISKESYVTDAMGRFILRCRRLTSFVVESVSRRSTPLAPVRDDPRIGEMNVLGSNSIAATATEAKFTVE